MLKEFFAFISQGWVGSLIGFIGVIIGVLGIFSYKISKSRGRPSIQRHSIRIIGKEDTEVSDDLEILYKGEKVERLTKTVIVFWNDGTETINGKDVVNSDKISFCFSEGERILSSRIISVTRQVNNATLVKDNEQKNIAKLDFDFFDPNDGVTIEFLHTDKKRYPSITGTIKGIPAGIYDAGRYIDDTASVSNRTLSKVFKNRKKVMYIAMVIGMILFLIGLLPSSVYEHVDALVKSDPSKSEGSPERWFFLIFGAVYASSAAFVLWMGRRKYPKALWHGGTDS